MSVVITGYACVVCGAPANALRAFFADAQAAPPTPAAVTAAYCAAHVPADWRLDVPRTLTPSQPPPEPR